MIAPVRLTTGLLLITLLTVIHLSNSLIYYKNLDIVQEYLQGGIKEAATKKRQLMNELILEEYYHEAQLEKIYPFLRQLMAVSDSSSPLKRLKNVIINFLVKERSDFARIKKALEKEIEEIWSIIELQEDAHDEL